MASKLDFKSLENSELLLVVASSDSMQQVTLDVLKYFVNTKNSFCIYVTVAKPYNTIMNILNKNGIKTDRIFFIDEKGGICNSSLISCLIIKNLLKEKRHAGIIYNLVCSKIVPETIVKFGGKAIIERVGHSYIKDTMRKTGAVFACEHSAHYYYKDNFNADSGIISSLIVSGIVSKENKKLSSLLEEFQKYHKIEETNFKVEGKKAAMESIEKHYKRQKPEKILKLDGITVEFKDWWFNVRPSNTEPLLRLNLEAQSGELLAEKLKEIKGLLAPEAL